MSDYTEMTDFKNKSGQQLEKMNTNLQKLLKDFALEIVIESNFKPKRWNILLCNKPDNCNQYIHSYSKYPPNIINQIPAAFEQHFSKLFSKESCLNELAIFYEEKLNKSGYNN